MVLNDCLRHLQERLGTAGAQVENAGLVRIIIEPQVHLAHVVYIYKVTLLPTVRIAIPTLEQLGILASFDLFVQVIGHGRHLALVLLSGAVDVEVTEADNLATGRRQNRAHVLVKLPLGIAIDVQWPFALARFPELIAGAVDRRTGGVEKRHFVVQAPMQQHLGVGVVVLHHELAVPLGGV